jgi:hypothetical protein
MRSQVLARVLVIFGAAAVFGAGCAATVQGGAYGEADPPVVFADPPTLVEIDAGVWVVRDYDRPVYYFGDDYWVYRDGVWFRSHSYDGGWARVEATVVPVAIARRDHRAYVHYRGEAAAPTQMAPRRPRDSNPDRGRPEQAREHRDPGPPDRGHEHRDPGAPDHGPEHRDAVREHAADPHASPEHRGEQRGSPPGRDDSPGRGGDHQEERRDAPPAADQRGGGQGHGQGNQQQNKDQNKDKKRDRDKGDRKH